MNKFWIHWFTSSVILMVLLYLTLSWNYIQCPWCDESGADQSVHTFQHFQGENSSLTLSYGIITDVHGPWHTQVDPTSLSNEKKRSYIQQAVAEWRKTQTDFVISLGDFVNFMPDKVEIPIDRELISEVLKNVGKDIYFSWGNHDFWTLSRKALWQSPFANLEMTQKRIGKDFNPSTDGHYFSFYPRDNIKIIILDCYDSTSIGRSEETTVGKKSLYDNFNGGISAIQLQWLNEQLEEADSKGATLLIHGHIPLDRKMGSSKFFLTNGEEVRQILLKYRRSLKLYIAGHAHRGAAYRERDDLIHVTIDSWTEETREPSGSAAYGIIRVWNDRIELNGFGPMVSRTFPVPKVMV